MKWWWWWCLACLVIALPIIQCQTIDDYNRTGCSNIPDGSYPLRNLTQYMVCKNGTQTFKSCPTLQQIYSSANNQCVPLTNVTEETFCNDRPSGDWRYLWDCHKYIHCYFNWYQVNLCEQDKVYDAVKDVCLDQKDAGNFTHCQMINSSSTVTGNNTKHINGTSAKGGSTNHTNANLTDSGISGNSTNANSTVSGNSGNSTNANSTVSGNSGNSTNGNSTVSGNSGNSTNENSAVSSNSGNSTNGNSTDTGKNTTTGQIRADQLQKKLESGKIILIDVRELWELRTEGKIGQSVNIPLATVEKSFQMDNHSFKEKYGIDKPSKDNCDLVFHCRSGVRSQKAVDIVKTLGYTCPQNLIGGFEAWKKIYLKK